MHSISKNCNSSISKDWSQGTNWGSVQSLYFTTTMPIVVYFTRKNYKSKLFYKKEFIKKLWAAKQMKYCAIKNDEMMKQTWGENRSWYSKRGRTLVTNRSQNSINCFCRKPKNVFVCTHVFVKTDRKMSEGIYVKMLKAIIFWLIRFGVDFTSYLFCNDQTLFI